MSSETADPRREVVNPGYMAMLAQRGVRARDHALLGSDDGTDDAGVGAPAGLSYAARARGVGPIGGGVDPWGNGGRFAGWGESGRAGTARVEGGEGGYGRVMPLHVRKMPSV